MLSRGFVLTFLIAVSLPLATRADMSEQDRQARCANNQARIDALEAEIRGDKDAMSDEEIARARAEMVSLGSFMRDYQRFSNEELRQRARNMHAVARRYMDAIYETACNDTTAELTCANMIRLEIGSRIDRAVAARPRLQALEQQIAHSRSNLTALRCNEPAGPDTQTADSIAARFAMLRDRMSQEQYAEAYARMAVLLAGYGDTVGWINGMDSSVPGDPGRGVTNPTAHHDHVINHGGGDVAGSVSSRLDDLRQRLSPSAYAAMEREASQLLAGYGV